MPAAPGPEDPAALVPTRQLLEPLVCVRAHSPALTVLSALSFSSPTHVPVSHLHTKPLPALLFPSESPSLAFVLYNAGPLVRKLIKVIIPCTEMCLSSHSYFMFLPLDLLTLFNSWYYTTHRALVGDPSFYRVAIRVRRAPGYVFINF